MDLRYIAAVFSHPDSLDPDSVTLLNLDPIGSRLLLKPDPDPDKDFLYVKIIKN
jgi:hypothetical protein